MFNATSSPHVVMFAMAQFDGAQPSLGSCRWIMCRATTWNAPVGDAAHHGRGEHVHRQRSEADQQIADLLRTAKKSLGMSVAFLSRMYGTTQHLEVVESSIPMLFHDGIQLKQESTFCQLALDGKLPAVMPDMRKSKLAMSLSSARIFL